MQKQDIVQAIVAIIEKELASATRSARETADEATDDESRPENKYDTRGLEASYVASAQAHYAKDLLDALQAYRNLTLPESSNGCIALGSLVTTLSSSGRARFFIGPARGGLEINLESEIMNRESISDSITVLTPSSPLGTQLLGKQVGSKTQGATSHTVIEVQ